MLKTYSYYTSYLKRMAMKNISCVRTVLVLEGRNMTIYICGENKEYIVNCLKSEVAQNNNIVYLDEECLENVDYNINNGDVFIANDSQAKFLMSKGVRRTQLINYEQFGNLNFDNPLDGFDSSFNGLVLGMSHSQCGLDVSYSKNINYFKVASPSMDIFLHINFFEALLRNYAETLRNMKSIIIEIPYYIFNYDLSRCVPFAYSKLNYFDIVHNWHHLKEKELFEAILEDYNLYKKIFRVTCSTKVTEHRIPIVLKPLKRVYKYLRSAYKGVTNSDNVWKKTYNETIKENTYLWNKLIELIKEECPSAQISILVMPFNPSFIRTHKTDIDRNREYFYNSIVTGERINIIDNFIFYNMSFYFDDHCHLNDIGCKRYSRKFFDTFDLPDSK